MKEISQFELQVASGASQRDVENWMSRLPLATKFRRTVRGKPRTFSVDNAIEMALLARFTKSGFTPAAAAVRIRELFEDWKFGGRTNWAIVFWNDESELAKGMGLSEAPGPELFNALKNSGEIYTIVNTGEIIERVSQHFGSLSGTEGADSAAFTGDVIESEDGGRG